MRLAPRLHQRYLSWWIDRHRKLGSDETGAKSYDVHAPRRSAQPSVTTDSSPSPSREARHGVAQALVDKVREGLLAEDSFSAAAQRAVDEGSDALDALLRLIDELADRLYGATAGCEARIRLVEAERDRWERAYDESMALIPEDRAVAAEARAETLSAALVGYVGAHHRECHIGAHHEWDLRVTDAVRDAARAALAARLAE